MTVLEFEPYEDSIVPLPRPWHVNEDGKVVNPELDDLGMQVLTIEDGYATVKLHNSVYIFPQRITKIKD